MKLIDRYTTTISTSNTDILIAEVREAFLQYEVIWTQCLRMTEVRGSLYALCRASCGVVGLTTGLQSACHLYDSARWQMAIFDKARERV